MSTPVTEKIFKLASESLLDSADITEHQLETILSKAMTRSVDYADLYLQNHISEGWLLEENAVKNAESHHTKGFGLRVISGEKVGFAYADDIGLTALNKAVKSARSIVHTGGQALVRMTGHKQVASLYPQINPIDTYTEVEKVALLHGINKVARNMDPRVCEVIVSLAASYDVVMILNSQGQLAADIRPLIRVSVRVIVEENGRREQGSASGGARAGYEFLIANEQAYDYARKAVEQAVRNLNARPAPAGMMEVVLGPGWPAVLLHEAVGHGLEGDFNRKGTSVFSGRMGQRVASSLCTIVDDSTIPGRRGSLAIDDEGTPGQNTVLIENGILRGYMQDTHNAKLMGVQSTGNGRRESYAHLPIPRMTNTYMLPGESDPAEIIASVKRGLYAVDFSGGQVDITSGQFVFSANEAYIIENGKIAYPVRGATLAGSGSEVLNHVSMVGNDFQLDPGSGSCGKAGQSVPVCVGQATLKVDQLTVGGSE